MDIPALIQTYGYAAIFVGAFLEGETILAAGAGSRRSAATSSCGSSSWWRSSPASSATSSTSSSAATRGRSCSPGTPSGRPRCTASTKLLSRYHAPLIIGDPLHVRVSHRRPDPARHGARVDAWKFVVYNFIGACIWAPLIAGLGYLFGHAVEILLQDIKQFEIIAMVVIVVISLATWLVWRYRQRQKEKAEIRGPEA